MKIAFTTNGTDWQSEMDPRFGRAEFLLIYDEELKVLSHYDNHDAAIDAHGAGSKTAQRLFEVNPAILITGNGPGSNATAILEKTGIIILTGATNITVHQAYKKYKNGEL